MTSLTKLEEVGFNNLLTKDKYLKIKKNEHILLKRKGLASIFLIYNLETTVLGNN